MYEYTDSTGKKWLLENQGYYFQWQSNMWSAYGEMKIVKTVRGVTSTSRWNAADLEISTTMKELIEKIERRRCQ